MISWKQYPQTQPPIGVPLLVWNNNEVQRAKFERDNGKWVWITYTDQNRPGYLVGLFLPENRITWWSLANAPY